MKVKIYNVNYDFSNAEAKKGNYYSFMSYESLERHGLKCARCNYDLVWEHEFPEPMSEDKLYSMLNRDDRPEDFRGHSLSVSDVVVLDDKVLYCDDIGWKELPSNWDAGVSAHVQDRCNACGCEYACVYGCKSKCDGQKIANDGIGITAMLDNDGKIVIYYTDILNCPKWLLDTNSKLRSNCESNL